MHYCTNSPIEPYWSVTKYNDIMHVDTNHGIFSSDVTLGGISIRDVPPGYDYPSFIAMDQPRHSAQRKTVSPMFTPTHLDELAVLIRERAGKVLDALPRNETFNFVDRVSIELTTQMLATLFDFPWEERRKLTRWSDVSTALPKSGVVEFGGAAPRRDGRMRGLFHQTLERARQCRAAQRPDLDDGAQRRHPAHGPRQSDGQHHPVDRRRQRHHPQHHERLGAGAERTPRPVPEAARQSGADRQHGAGSDPLADAAGAYAAHRAGRYRTRRQDRSRRATAS